MTNPRPDFENAALDIAYGKNAERAEFVKTSLRVIRDIFRSQLPQSKGPKITDIHAQICKNTLQSILLRAELVGQSLGFSGSEMPFHILGTTRKIYNDLQDFYAEDFSNSEKAKDICARQNALYDALDKFDARKMEYGFFDTQLLIGRYITNIIPAAPKVSVFGFGA